MGAGNSSGATRQWTRSDAEVVAVMMPIYFVNEDVSHADREAAIKSWDYVLNDTSTHFNEMKGVYSSLPGFFVYTCADFVCFVFFLFKRIRQAWIRTSQLHHVFLRCIL